jgi:uncharacterized membrane protein
MNFGPLIPVSTMAGRLGVIFLGVVAMLGFLALAMRLGPSFFRGFLVAVGTFLSFDMILFHWVFRLHRITSGPEADIVEPAFVLLGLAFIVYGIRAERASQRLAQPDGLRDVRATGAG